MSTSTSMKHWALPVFPNTMQMRTIVPRAVWRVARFGTVALTLVICALLLAQPSLGLFLFWHVAVALLPLLFFIAPGVWRNICPLAAVNQTPRVLRFTRGIALPQWLREYYYVFGITFFFAAVTLRKVIFNQNGTALAILILGIVGAALTGGVIFKGKSGWCSTMCPLLPVQRVYGQTPFLVSRNSHCTPCVGCVKNCYDFNPRVAYLADLYDGSRRYSAYRKFFVGAFPGLILGYFLIANPPAISIGSMYAQFVLYIVVSAGSFYVLNALLRVTDNKLTALYAIVALNLFYWFTFPLLATTLPWPTMAAPEPLATWLANPVVAYAIGTTPKAWAVTAAQATLLALSLVWLARTYRKEGRFVRQAAAKKTRAVGRGQALTVHQAAQRAKPQVTITPDERYLVVLRDTTLLDVAESQHLPLEAGCRMGICGADPVCILKGSEYLSPVTDDERSTLDRLGLGGSTRMACSARIRGPVSFSLKLEQ